MGALGSSLGRVILSRGAKGGILDSCLKKDGAMGFAFDLVSLMLPVTAGCNGWEDAEADDDGCARNECSQLQPLLPLALTTYRKDSPGGNCPGRTGGWSCHRGWEEPPGDRQAYPRLPPTYDNLRSTLLNATAPGPCARQLTAIALGLDAATCNLPAAPTGSLPQPSTVPTYLT